MKRVTTELPAAADTIIDLCGQIVLPGFVNTHHHLNQTLARNLVAAQNNNVGIADEGLGADRLPTDATELGLIRPLLPPLAPVQIFAVIEGRLGPRSAILISKSNTSRMV
jgi:imidazolonepropionase-like amidohydrolase